MINKFIFSLFLSFVTILTLSSFLPCYATGLGDTREKIKKFYMKPSMKYACKQLPNKYKYSMSWICTDTVNEYIFDKNDKVIAITKTYSPPTSYDTGFGNIKDLLTVQLAQSCVIDRQRDWEYVDLFLNKIKLELMDEEEKEWFKFDACGLVIRFKKKLESGPEVLFPKISFILIILEDYGNCSLNGLIKTGNCN